MEDFSSNEPIGPIEGPPKSGEGEENPFIEGPDSFKGRANPSLTRPAFTPKKEIIKEQKSSGPPSPFKGGYGVAETRKMLYAIGRKGGYKDYASELRSPVRQKLLKLREEFFPKGHLYVKKQELQYKINHLKRDMPSMASKDPAGHIAATNFLKEINEKLGLK